MNTIEEIDEILTVVQQRASSFYFEDEALKFMGEEWVANNPSFHGIYSISTLTNAALDRRLELMEGESNGDIQEELDAITGADINVG